MDPTECLVELLLSIVDGDSNSRNDHYENLSNWLDNGGFIPHVDAAYEEFCRRLREEE